MTKSRIGRSIAKLVILALVGISLMVFAIYWRDLRKAQARLATGSSIANTVCGPIEYAVAGEGPPVVVVHGAGGGFDQGMAFGEALQARGFRVIAMSRFGYLHTPLPADASAAAQADAHACLLDTLHIRRAAIIGVSAGAPSSLQFALRHPQRVSALVLLVPGIYTPRPGNAPSLKTPPRTPFLFDTALSSDFLFWAATRVARRTMVRSILATPTEVLDGASPDEQARAAGLLDLILPVSKRRDGLINDAEVTSSLPRYELERVTTPTLANSVADDLFGTYDGARYSAEHIAHARFVGYTTGGHIWIGHHEEVVAEIADFLKQYGPGSVGREPPARAFRSVPASG